VRATVAAVLLLLVAVPASQGPRAAPCHARQADVCPHGAGTTEAAAESAALVRAERACCSDHAPCGLCVPTWAAAAPVGSLSRLTAGASTSAVYRSSVGALLVRALDHVPLA